MSELLHEAAHHVELAIEAIAVLCIAIGAVEAAIGVGRLMLRSRPTTSAKQEIWLGFAGWLVAALTFQVAADIVGTAIAPTWDEIGKLAAIAAIRTFISFFLDRDRERMLEERLQVENDR